VLGRVVLVEKGDILIDTTQGRWRTIGRVLAALPARTETWGHRLALLERCRRPFYPPLYMGSADALFRQLGNAYVSETDVFAANEGLSREEVMLRDAYLRGGKRLLVVGAGPGREVVAFARDGLS